MDISDQERLIVQTAQHCAQKQPQLPCRTCTLSDTTLGHNIPAKKDSSPHLVSHCSREHLGAKLGIPAAAHTPRAHILDAGCRAQGKRHGGSAHTWNRHDALVLTCRGRPNIPPRVTPHPSTDPVSPHLLTDHFGDFPPPTPSSPRKSRGFP
eukprot:747478-Hanusia_phi.AAC.3